MSLKIDLSGRAALVTGAAGGIGEAIGQLLLDAGAKVVFADLNLPDVASRGENALAVEMDITDRNSVVSAIETCRGRFGSCDILVNNAAIAARNQGMPFTNQDADDWRSVLEVDAIGPFQVTREFARLHTPGSKGVVINIASVAARMDSQTDPAYSSAKSALLTFTRIAAKDLAPDIRVCAVCPGMVATHFYDDQYDAAVARDHSLSGVGSQGYFDQKAQRLIPLGVGQSAEDIANMVAFLASDLAGSITGQTVNVDGGLVMN